MNTELGCTVNPTSTGCFSERIKYFFQSFCIRNILPKCLTALSPTVGSNDLDLYIFAQKLGVTRGAGLLF